MFTHARTYVRMRGRQRDPALFLHKISSYSLRKLKFILQERTWCEKDLNVAVAIYAVLQQGRKTFQVNVNKRAVCNEKNKNKTKT